MTVRTEPGTLLSEPRHLNEAVASLVWLAQAGDEEAFTRLAERCHRQIHRWALGLTGDADDADDVTQEVLITLHRTLRSFEGRSRFTSWLYRITRNAALGLVRKRQRSEKWEQRDERDQRESVAVETVASDRTEALLGSEVGEVVKMLLRELPQQQRVVFDLVDLQGYTPTEVAEMLEMKAVTVRAHLHKGRRRIRTAILDRHREIAEEYGHEGYGLH